MRKITLLILSIAFLNGNAQTKRGSKNGMNGIISKMAIPGIPNLTIGDQVPDFEIPNLINSTKRVVKMADFKDKLLIIDFWSTWCVSCVEGLPHMEALQKQFGNKVMILPATYQSEEIAGTFWKTNKTTKNLTIPSVVNDRILLSYFRHNVYSHEVWIYKGKVIALTGAQYVDANHIQQVLNGDKINWPVKNDFVETFDGYTQYLFSPDPVKTDTASSTIKYAAICGFKDLSPGSKKMGLIRDPVKKTVRVFMLNFPILNLYSIMSSGMGSNVVTPQEASNPLFNRRIIWQVADRNKYQYISKEISGYNEDWTRKNAVCFEILMPDTMQTEQQIYQSGSKELNDLLGVKAGWEKRKEKVWVLIKTADKLSAGTPGKGEKLLEGLNFELNREGNPYVFDETNYTGSEVIGDFRSWKINWNEFNDVRKALHPYGLDLKEEERLVDRFVFKELNWKN